MNRWFNAEYQLFLESGLDPEQVARNICLEQTVELSDDLVVEDSLRNHVVGQVETLTSQGNSHRLVVRYSGEVSGFEIPQLLNVLYGNISLKHGIKLVDVDVSSLDLPGPRFGIAGIRELCGVPDGPLICTALKPMGSSSEVLAEMAYELALGGLDIIKDDHGLANQSFAPFRDRVLAVSKAVQKANLETGRNCLYMPNFAPPHHRFQSDLSFLAEQNVRGILMCPMLLGMDALRMVREESELAIMTHPALTGGFFSNPHHGISPGLLIAKWFRLLGADACIYPNIGGRFIFDLDTCHSINQGCRSTIDDVLPAFPVPAGGMSLSQIPQMRKLYGDDLIILIGSGLFREHPDLSEAAKLFRKRAHEALT